MMCPHVSHLVALPAGWSKHVRCSLVHAISPAATAQTPARSRGGTRAGGARRLQVILLDLRARGPYKNCKINV